MDTQLNNNSTPKIITQEDRGAVSLDPASFRVYVHPAYCYFCSLEGEEAPEICAEHARRLAVPPVPPCVRCESRDPYRFAVSDDRRDCFGIDSVGAQSSLSETDERVLDSADYCYYFDDPHATLLNKDRIIAEKLRKLGYKAAITRGMRDLCVPCQWIAVGEYWKSIDGGLTVKEQQR